MFGPSLPEDALFFSRTDANQPLSSFARQGFELDGQHWPSVEHYFQANKYAEGDWQDAIRTSPHPKQAQKMGRRRFKGLRKDWRQVRRVIMTRAVYTRCRTHEEAANALLETGERILVNNNPYDYFWGCGRDRRGGNVYGQVLMDVREKLRAEQAQSAAPEPTPDTPTTAAGEDQG